MPDFRLDDEIVIQSEGRRVYKRFVPLGVAALLVPWNFPISKS